MKPISNRLSSLFPFLIISILLLLSPAALSASDKTSENKQLLLEADNLRDKSLHKEAFDICQKIAASYRADMTKDDKQICLNAIYGCIDDAMAVSNYSDVAKYMVLAEEIRDSENITDGSLEIYYSCMYIRMGSEAGSQTMFAKGFPHAVKAFEYAVETGNRRKMELAFFHLIGYYRELRTKELRDKMEAASHVFETNIPDNRSREIFMRYYKAIRDEYENNDYKAAALQYDSILSLLPNDALNARKRATFLIYAADSRLNSGNARLAIEGVKDALVLADSLQQGEYKVAGYNSLLNIYDALGDTVMANLYHNKKQLVQDSISTYAVADDIYVLDRIKEEKELHRQISIARYRSNVLKWITIFGGIVLLIVVAFLLVLRCKNAGLTERARILRQLLREHSRNQYTTPADSSSLSSENDDNQSKTKYAGSSLSEDEKNNIATSIREVLDSEAVFSPEFSLGTLAEKIGKNPKAVSQVINEFFNTNFSTVVNRIRIYEACHRFDSPEYANWSVEGIAESVGYTQRNTFSTNFKKFTGMGIREYKKLSDEEKENISSHSSTN